MKHIYDVEPGEVLLGGLRRRLGRRPLLHRLRAAAARLHDGALRGQAGRDARRGRVLARDRRARRRDAVHGADRVPGDPPAGSRGRARSATTTWPRFRALFLAGERCDPDTLALGARTKLGVPVIDHWWQTETGWPIAANCLGHRAAPGRCPARPTRPAPGWDLRVLDGEGARSPPGRDRRAGGQAADAARRARRRSGTPTSASARRTSPRSPATTRPATPATSTRTGYVFVMARTDDVINVAGHRLSTGAIEEVLAAHPDVAECAVIGVADELKGQLPLGFLVLKAGVERAARRDRRRESCSWCASGSARSRRSRPRVVVERLPKTRSGQDPARHDAPDRRRRGVHAFRRRSTIRRSSTRSARRSVGSATPRDRF